jgi:transposase
MERSRKKKYQVKLSSTQRKKLKSAFRGGKAPVLELRRMQALLLADVNGPNYSDEKTATVLNCSTHTVLNIRRKFVERGLSGAISRKTQDEPSRLPLLDGHGEARLIALACGEAPEGISRWTLRLLAERAVELEIADHLSYETVRRVLKKRTQAAPEASMVHPAKRRRRIRRSHGGRLGSLLPAS